MKKRIFYILSVILVLILLALGVFYPRSIDQYGYYYWNLLGVYYKYGGSGGLFIIVFPSKLKYAKPYDFQIIHTQLTDGNPNYMPQYTYAKSGSYIYFNGDIVEGADSNTFRHAGGGYAIDNKSVYYRGHKQHHINLVRFKFHGGVLASDNYGFYLQTIPILKRLDGNKLGHLNIDESIVVSNNFAVDVSIRDKDGVYKVGEQIQVVKTGEVYEEVPYPRGIIAYIAESTE